MWNDEKERIELNVRRHNNASDNEVDDFRRLVFWTPLHERYRTTRNRFNRNDDDADPLSVSNKDLADSKATTIESEHRQRCPKINFLQSIRSLQDSFYNQCDNKLTNNYHGPSLNDNEHSIVVVRTAHTLPIRVNFWKCRQTPLFLPKINDNNRRYRLNNVAFLLPAFESWSTTISIDYLNEPNDEWTIVVRLQNKQDEGLFMEVPLMDTVGDVLRTRSLLTMSSEYLATRRSKTYAQTISQLTIKEM